MPLRVLVVDDQDELRQLIGNVCTMAGDIELSEAAEGQQALDHVNQHPCDLVLLDVTMPGMDGLTAARQLCQRTPRPKVYIMSGEDEETSAAAARETGADGILPKPFQMAKLLELLQNCRSAME